MVEKIGIGSVQFGLNYGISNKQGITDANEAKRILDYAQGKGIDLIDTASGYGKSEEVLGKIGVASFKIVTKFITPTPENSIKEQINTSLNRLCVNHLYGLLAHRPAEIVDNPEIWDYLLKLKQENVVEKIGFSFNTPEEIELLIDKGFIPDLIQVPFNYLDQRFQPYIVQLKKNGCEIHSRSVFLQGLFFTSPSELDSFFGEVKPIIEYLQTNGEDLPGLLLKYCLEKPFIDKVIFGVNDLKQLMSNIKSINNVGSLAKNKIKIKHEILTPSKWPKII